MTASRSNTYVHDLGATLGSHVKFTGSAQISPGWSAGYVLQIEAIGADGLTDEPGCSDSRPRTASRYRRPAGDSGAPVILVRKIDQLGKLGVGKQSQASDNTAILVDGSGSLVPANWVAFDVNSFQIRNSADGTFVGQLGCASVAARLAAPGVIATAAPERRSLQLADLRWLLGQRLVGRR